MIARRAFLIAAGGLVVAPLASAQQPGRTYRVAIVLAVSPLAEMAGPDPIHPLTRVILHELRSLGYVEGRNLVFERRTAEGSPARYPEIIASAASACAVGGARGGRERRRGSNRAARA